MSNRFAVYSGEAVGSDYIVHTSDCRSDGAEIVDEYFSRLDVYVAGYGSTLSTVYPYGSPPWYDECHKRGTAGVMWHACALELPEDDPKNFRTPVVEQLSPLVDGIVGADGVLADVPSSTLVKLFDDIVGNASPEHRRKAAGKFGAAFNTWLANVNRLPEHHYYDGLLGRYYCGADNRHRECPKLPSLVDSARMWLNDDDRGDTVAHIRPEMVEESHTYAAHELTRSLCETIGGLLYVPSVGLSAAAEEHERTLDEYMRADMAGPCEFDIVDNYGREYTVTVAARGRRLVITSPAVPGVELTGAALDVLAALKTD